METDKRRKFIINFVYFLIIFAIIYFLFKYAVFVLMPFVIAFIISAILQPLINLLVKKCKFKRRFASGAVVTLFYCTIGVLITLIIVRMFNYAFDTIKRLPTYYTETLLPAIKNVLLNIQLTLSKFSIETDISVDEVMGALTKQASDLSSIVKTVTSIVIEMPSLLVSGLIMIISTFFISADFGYLGKWCLAQLPEKKRNTVCEIKIYVTQILAKYIRSYALILLITFTELVIAFSVVWFIFPDLFSSMTNIMAVAALIALFDILPIVGTGTVLIPWSAFMLIVGNYPKALAIILIYIIITIIRHIIEPKIIGQQVGLHPIVTLIAMIVGTALFGVIGLFGLPISLALIKDLDDRGKIHVFKYPEKESEK